MELDKRKTLFSGNCRQNAIRSKIQPGRGRSKHRWVELKNGMKILFILENSWFNYIGNKRKKSKKKKKHPTKQLDWKRFFQHIHSEHLLFLYSLGVHSIQCQDTFNFHKHQFDGYQGENGITFLPILAYLNCTVLVLF